MRKLLFFIFCFAQILANAQKVYVTNPRTGRADLINDGRNVDTSSTQNIYGTKTYKNPVVFDSSGIFNNNVFLPALNDTTYYENIIGIFKKETISNGDSILIDPTKDIGMSVKFRSASFFGNAVYMFHQTDTVFIVNSYMSNSGSFSNVRGGGEINAFTNEDGKNVLINNSGETGVLIHLRYE